MGQTASTVILADTSSSMCGQPIIELRAKLAKLSPSMRGARILAFDSVVHEVESPEQLPEPSGSTRLDLAIERAREFQPFELIVISDGAPDDAEAALSRAREMPCVIQTIFIGDERQKPDAVRFMNKLAHENGGKAIVRRVTDVSFESAVRSLLQLPAPIPV
jgi:hypothetical protein